MSGEQFTKQEQWVPIHNFPGYFMSSDGKICIDLDHTGDKPLRTFRELDQFFLGAFWKN